MDNNPQLDERIWQAWIQKNAAQDQVRFRRRVKVIGLIALCLAFSALLFEIHKVSADVFELVMQHQNAFALPPNLGRQGLLQITTPTEIESRAAAASMKDAFDCVSSALAETLLPTG